MVEIDRRRAANAKVPFQKDMSNSKPPCEEIIFTDGAASIVQYRAPSHAYLDSNTTTSNVADHFLDGKNVGKDEGCLTSNAAHHIRFLHDQASRRSLQHYWLMMTAPLRVCAVPYKMSQHRMADEVAKRNEIDRSSMIRKSNEIREMSLN